MLQSGFHEAMLDVYRHAKQECGYNATRFLSMVGQHGGLKAAQMLLASRGGSEGFTELWELRRLDLSLECMVLNPRWSPLFSREELEVAQNRLRDVGFDRAECGGGIDPVDHVDASYGTLDASAPETVRTTPEA